MSYLEVLANKRVEVLSQIDDLRSTIADLSGKLAIKEGQLRNLDDLLGLEGATQPSVVKNGPSARALGPNSQRFTDAAVVLLTDAGHPVHYQALAKDLADRGVYVPGKDPGANLIAHMLRDPRFVRTQGRGMYGLASWPDLKSPPRRRSKTMGAAVKVPRRRKASADA